MGLGFIWLRAQLEMGVMEDKMGNFDGSKGLEFQASVLGFRLYG